MRPRKTSTRTDPVPVSAPFPGIRLGAEDPVHAATSGRQTRQREGGVVRLQRGHAGPEGGHLRDRGGRQQGQRRARHPGRQDTFLRW